MTATAQSSKVPRQRSSPKIAGLPHIAKQAAITFLHTGDLPTGKRARPPMPGYRFDIADAAAMSPTSRVFARRSPRRARPSRFLLQSRRVPASAHGPLQPPQHLDIDETDLDRMLVADELELSDGRCSMSAFNPLRACPKKRPSDPQQLHLGGRQLR